ncbi:membrane lipoprotein lipid attachment site-containing protein [Acidisphaera sp. L21]
MRRITVLIVLTVALAGCSGPFFYHDVIVPTYRQVDHGDART